MFYMNRFFLVAVVSIFFCGCNTSNKGCLRDTIVKLPDGSEIYTQRETVFSHDGKEIRSEESKGCIAIWKRPGQPEKKLVTLTPNSDSKNNYVCSTNSDKAKVNISDDGDRIWLVRDGQVIYSFDYQKGVAILGLHGQPEWAIVKD